jgi:cytochrome P450
MPSTPAEQPALPEAEIRFDIGAPRVLEHMTELFARHGDIYRLYMPARRRYAYVIHRPEDVKRVLVTNHRNYVKGVDRDRIRVLLGLGIMTSEGELWQRQRRMMQPLFHRRVVQQFGQLIDAANDRLIGRWTAIASRATTLNLTEEMSEFILEIVLRALFGPDVERLLEPFSLVTKSSARDLEFVYKFRALMPLVAEVIRERRAHGNSGKPHDYLGLMDGVRDRETNSAMNERQLIDEIMTLVVAGHETTASVLNWTWYLLSQHPAVEDRLLDELRRSCCAARPTLEQVESIDYARRVLSEAMRLYPPGWLLSRRTIEQDSLCGYSIPAGADVLLPLYLIHRHPRYWKNADQFDPDRFSPAHESERPKFAFVPFAAGPRHCIGESLALYEMLMHISKVVPLFRMRVIDAQPIELEAQINLRARYPLMMKISPR